MGIQVDKVHVFIDLSQSTLYFHNVAGLDFAC